MSIMGKGPLDFVSLYLGVNQSQFLVPIEEKESVWIEASSLYYFDIVGDLS